MKLPTTGRAIIPRMARAFSAVPETILRIVRRGCHLPFVAGLLAFAGGLAIGILAEPIRDSIFVNQDLVMQSEMTITSADSRQGDKALEWVFKIQPRKNLFVDQPAPVWAFAHLESAYDEAGEIQPMDLRDFRGLKFFASSDIEGLVLSEFNIFVGDSFLQYRRTQPPLRITTVWKEFYVAFDEFSLAPWVRQQRPDLPDEPDLSRVTALGLDMKASSSVLEATILIDYVRLIRKDDADKFEVLDAFENRHVSQPFASLWGKVRWKTGGGTLR